MNCKLKFDRNQAIEFLSRLGDLDAIDDLTYILSHTNNLYAFYFASGQLTLSFTKYFNSFSPEGRKKMRSFLHTCLQERENWLTMQENTGILKLAKESFSGLCVRVWKMCWFDIPSNLDPSKTHDMIKYDDDISVLDFALEALKNLSSFTLASLACTILSQVVIDMRKVVETLSAAKQRKIQMSFRQHQLTPLFVSCSDALGKILNDRGFTETTIPLLESILKLVLDIQTFMYHSTYPDESNDDIDIINVNSSWTGVLMNIGLFFEFYKLNTPLSPKCLEIIVNLLGMRSIGMDTEQAKCAYLDIVIDQVGSILQFKHGLEIPGNRHNLCRLFYRLESNYRIERLMEIKNFHNLIQLYLAFCFNLIENSDGELAAIFYALKFWSLACNRLSSKVTYENEVRELQDLVIAFLMRAVYLEENREHIDTYLNDLEQNHIMKLLPKIILCVDRKEISDCIIEEANKIGSFYSMAVSQNNIKHVEQAERQLSWLIHAIDCIVHDRTSNNDDDVYIDADLTVCVFTILNVHSQRVSSSGKTDSTRYLEYALICFSKGFVLNFFGAEEEHILTSLSKCLNLHSSEMILDVFLDKIVTNMKLWSEDDAIIMETLEVLSSLTSTKLSSILMGKSSLAHNLIANHNEVHLGGSRAFRTQFYKTVSKSILSDLDGDMFEMFIDGFDKKLYYINSQLEMNNYTVLNELDLLLSDLRGLVISCLTHQTYLVLFEWFFGRGYYFTLIPNALKYFLQHKMASAFVVLKFISSFVDNETRRISFSSHSSDGLILFKQTAEILIAVGESIFTIPQEPRSDKYTYSDVINKLIQYFFSIFAQIVGGDYCYYGAIYYYNDDVLARLLIVCLKILGYISLPEAHEYKKTLKALYASVEKICMLNITNIFQNIPENQIHIQEALSLILNTIRYGLSLREIRAVMNKSSYAFEMITKHAYSIKNGIDPNVYNHNLHGPIINDIMMDIFETLVTDTGEATFTLSKALFCTILFEPESFKQLKDAVIKSQAEVSIDKGQKMEHAFEELVEGLSLTFTRDNIDVFSQNAMSFRNTTKIFIDQVSFYRHLGR